MTYRCPLSCVPPEALTVSLCATVLPRAASRTCRLTGPFVLGGLVNQGEDLRDLLRALGMDRDRGRDFLVSLVQLGYLQRTAAGPADDASQDIPLEPAERGRAAAMAVQRAVQDVDTKLAEHCSPEEIRGMRSALIVLNGIREEARGQASS